MAKGSEHEAQVSSSALSCFLQPVYACATGVSVARAQVRKLLKFKAKPVETRLVSFTGGNSSTYLILGVLCKERLALFLLRGLHHPPVPPPPASPQLSHPHPTSTVPHIETLVWQRMSSAWPTAPPPICDDGCTIRRDDAVTATEMTMVV